MQLLLIVKISLIFAGLVYAIPAPGTIVARGDWEDCFDEGYQTGYSLRGGGDRKRGVRPFTDARTEGQQLDCTGSPLGDAYNEGFNKGFNDGIGLGPHEIDEKKWSLCLNF
ncbi:hypothetical protein CPB85DRAFT_1311940, partial [Mucidula mucida]